MIALTFVSACSVTPQIKEKQVHFSDEFPHLIAAFEQLSSPEFEGRKTETLGNLKAQAFIIDSLKQVAVQPFQGKYKHPFTFQKGSKTFSGTNIVGFIPCKKANCLNTIVLTAHFDHLGVITANRAYLGADDNASGTAALLSIAEKLQSQNLNYHYLILFTDAEEKNLKGAKAFVSDNSTVIDDVILNINMDMLAGTNKTKTLHFVSHGLNSLLLDNRAQYDDLIGQQVIRIRNGFRGLPVGNKNRRIKWLTASDHGVFHRKKIPFIYFGVGTHENYHTSRDSFENANKAMLIGATQSIYNVIIFMDKKIKKTNQ